MGVVACAVFVPAATAHAWTGYTPTRLGYQSAPPTSWPVPDPVGSFLGTDTPTATVRAQTGVPYTGGNVNYDGMVEVVTGMASPLGSKGFTETWSIPSGQSWAVVYTYAHLKDRKLGRTGVGNGQFADWTVGATNFGKDGGTSDYRWAKFDTSIATNPNVYFYGYDPGLSAQTSVTPSGDWFPGSKHQQFRSFGYIAAKWNSGTSKWDVTVKHVGGDGLGYSSYAATAAISPTGGNLAVTLAQNVVPNGFQFRMTTDASGATVVRRLTKTEAGLCGNLEFAQAVTTTDTAEVAAVALLTPDRGDLVTLPGFATDELSAGESDPGDSPSSSWSESDWYNKAKAWASALVDSVLWPVNWVDELGLFAVPDWL